MTEIQQFIKDSNNIIFLIDYLNQEFDRLYEEISLAFIRKFCKEEDLSNIYFKHNAYAYYLNGHCYSYAQILLNIFGDNATLYNTASHVLVKINNELYDVTGKVINSTAQLSTLQDLYYIETCFGIKDSYEKIIEDKLTELGKNYIHNYISNIKTRL